MHFIKSLRAKHFKEAQGRLAKLGKMNYGLLAPRRPDSAIRSSNLTGFLGDSTRSMPFVLV